MENAVNKLLFFIVFLKFIDNYYGVYYNLGKIPYTKY